MNITRRDFLKASAALGGALSLRASGLLELQKVFAGGPDSPPVIWLQGQSCTGCSVSFLNSIYYATVDDLLINKLDVKFQSTVMAAAGDLAVESAEIARSEGGYILVIEGSIPSEADGGYCRVWENTTMLQAFESFAASADAIIALGTCASYGGMYAASPNPTGAMGVEEALDYLGLQATVINIPGCPIHPDWFVGTVAMLLNGQMPVLDEHGRPEDFYKRTVHDKCPNKIKLDAFMEQYGMTGDNLKMDFNLDGEVNDIDLAILEDAGYGLKAKVLSETGCLKELGCKGPDTRADCPIRKWHNPGPGEQGVNWCVDSRSPCHGCTEPNFPDGMTPFYKIGQPAVPTEPGSDTITITKAEYTVDTQQLRVEATSTDQPNAVLTVVGFGAMTWNAANNRYEYLIAPVSDPGGSVTITSNLGGSATAAVVHTGGEVPGADTITITKSEYRLDTSELRVEATSTAQPNTVLTLEGYGQMTWKADKNKYEYRVKPIADPGSTVTVVSSLGGSATAEVEHKYVEPPTTDSITIIKAEYKTGRRELKVEATSSAQPKAVLTVEGYGRMTYKAEKNKYEYRAKGVADPGNSITVTSNLGGNAVASVKHRR